MRSENTGNKLEKTIYCILKENNIPFEHHKHKFCVGLWGEDVVVDFSVPTIVEFQAIEAKWQQSTGSVDQKLHYAVANIKSKYPCKTILIIDGGAFKPQVLEWIKHQVDGNFVGVYTLSEFLVNLNNGSIHHN